MICFQSVPATMYKADNNILQIHKTILNHSRTLQGSVLGNKISFTNTVGVMIIPQILKYKSDAS